jgi:hypothetical protein
MRVEIGAESEKTFAREPVALRSKIRCQTEDVVNDNDARPRAGAARSGEVAAKLA